MTGRRDHYHDPDAPTPNSLIPGAAALVTDEHGRVLLQRRTDSGNWSLPGGTMNIGETLQQCAIREVKEETGLDIAITGLLGIYTDPAHVIAYPDGEVRQEFTITYLARATGGTLTVSDESTDLRYIHPTDFDHIPIHDTVRLRLHHHTQHRDTPYLG